jgi:hypothetical protein
MLVMTEGETNQKSSMCLDMRLARTGYPRGWVPSKTPVLPHQCQTVGYAKASFIDFIPLRIWPDYTMFPAKSGLGMSPKDPKDSKDLQDSECRIKCGSQTKDLMSWM